MCFFLYCSLALRVLHSFPTRRSSDLLLVRDQRLVHLVVALERASERDRVLHRELRPRADREVGGVRRVADQHEVPVMPAHRDRKSTRLNSSHTVISYAVFCLKKKIKK